MKALVRDRWGLLSWSRRHWCDAESSGANFGASLRSHWRTLLVLLLVAVTYLALTPKRLVGLESGLDKVGHLLAFTALGFTGYLGFPTGTALPFALLAYGGLIEVLQLFVPGHSAEWGDLLANGIGIGVGIGLAAFVLDFRLRQRPDAYTVLK